MIVLFGGGPAFGLPEVSPYVTKTEVQLKIGRIPFVKELSRPDASPKGQIPFIQDNGRQVADSTFIRAYVERRFGIDLDQGLSSVERAESWAIERMIENHLGWVAGYERFMIEENFRKGPAHWFDGAPDEMREQLIAGLKQQMTTNLRAVGVGRHTPEEITWLGEKSLSSLSILLGDKPYLMGETATAIDATAFGALAQIYSPFFEMPLQRCARECRNLQSYVARLMERFYPDFTWEGA